MTANYLPLELDVEQVTIEKVPKSGWDITLERDDKEDLYVYMEMPDPLFDQLCDAEDIVYDEESGELVQGDTGQ